MCHPRGELQTGQQSRDLAEPKLKLQTTLQLLFHVLQKPLMAHGLIPIQSDLITPAHFCGNG